jgi:5,10-methylenetetrahydromethanopterin reductase
LETIMELSCAFATSPESPEHARIAESLGYRRAFFYDSPALYPDVWVQLCRTAERTRHIGLGPGVLIPSLRHPMVNAAAIATLADIAGAERVTVGIGSGFSGRMAMGQRSVRWRDVSDYVQAVRGLLRGDAVPWEGKLIRMMHPRGFAPPRPLEVPFLIGAGGPKGIAVAREVGDGVASVGVPIGGFARNVVFICGTVLAEGEDPGADRVLEAAGHAAATTLHGGAERGYLEKLLGDQGRRWLAAYDAVPAESRHLAMHDGHLVHVNDHDRPHVTGELLARLGLTRSAAGWRRHLARMEAAGATEVAYQPAGSDIPGELEAFIRTATG